MPSNADLRVAFGGNVAGAIIAAAAFVALAVYLYMG
jgi:hypothetical protein